MEEYDIITHCSAIRYFKKGTQIRHRADGPAVEYYTGNKYWYINDKHHRSDGPAVELNWGHKEWWINGIRLSPEKEIIMNLWYENGRK